MEPKQHKKSQISKTKAYEFLKKENTAVIATVDIEGRPSTAVIYYEVDKKLHLNFITKSNTSKYVNVLTNSNVALCIYDEEKRFTIQVTGRVHEVKDEERQVEIMNRLAVVRHKNDASWVPPITHLKAGKLVVMSVDIVELKMSDFGNFGKSGNLDLVEHLSVKD